MLLRALIVVLALVGVVLLALRVALGDPASTRRRVEALFRRPERRATPPEADHYYRRYWS